MFAGVAVNIGYSPTQMVSAAKPERIPADGIALTLTVVGDDSIEHPCVLNTRTVTCSPSLNVVDEMVLEVLDAPILTPFKKNS